MISCYLQGSSVCSSFVVDANQAQKVHDLKYLHKLYLSRLYWIDINNEAITDYKAIKITAYHRQLVL
jgi:hypothetical protein